MDWVESVVRYQYWWQSTITKYLKSKTDSQKQVTASHWKTGINCENPFATHGKANMVEMHIPGTGTKWKRKQSEKVTRKARPVEGGTLCCQTKESAHNYLSQSYLESSWNTRRSTSNELRSSKESFALDLFAICGGYFLQRMHKILIYSQSTLFLPPISLYLFK